jgi:ZIP family zinc transporter
MTALWEIFAGMHPLLQATVAGCGTWAITALGATLVFLGRELPQRLMDAMLGFAAGVMISASFWSLLQPAAETAAALGIAPWMPTCVGFLLGAAFLWLTDRLLPHLHPHLPPTETEGLPSSWRRVTLLVTAITLHNIPEGLAVGVAFGAAASDLGTPLHVSLGGAVALAIGIGLQNLPEGIAVALPLRREGYSARRSFWFGQLSAAVEPVAAAAGAAAVLWIVPILPYALSFAAGAMVYVVVEELLPAAQAAGRTDLSTTAAVLGFTVMMALDVALG